MSDERLVERVLDAMTAARWEEGSSMYDVARAAIAAVREAEDDALSRHNITDVHCVRLRMDDDDTAPTWRAFVCRNHVVSAETMWVGDGPTRAAAIQAAIRGEKP